MKRVLHITVQYMFWEAEEAAEGFSRQEVTPLHMIAGGGRIHIWWNRERPSELLDNSSLILTVVSLQLRCHSLPITDGNLSPLLYFPLPVCTSDGRRPQQWQPLSSQQPVIMTSFSKTSCSDQTPNKQSRDAHTHSTWAWRFRAQRNQTRGKQTYSWWTMNRESNAVIKRLLRTWALLVGNFSETIEHVNFTENDPTYRS